MIVWIVRCSKKLNICTLHNASMLSLKRLIALIQIVTFCMWSMGWMRFSIKKKPGLSSKLMLQVVVMRGLLCQLLVVLLRWKPNSTSALRIRNSYSHLPESISWVVCSSTGITLILILDLLCKWNLRMEKLLGMQHTPFLACKKLSIFMILSINYNLKLREFGISIKHIVNYLAHNIKS